MKFRVGDIITGKKSADSRYNFTTSHAIMEVVRVNQYEIGVCIMSHDRYKNCIGSTHTVNPGHFTLTQVTYQSNFIELDDEE